MSGQVEDKKLFPCGRCGQEFTKKCNLQRHERTSKVCMVASGLNPEEAEEHFDCGGCDFFALRQDVLDKHELQCEGLKNKKPADGIAVLKNNQGNYQIKGTDLVTLPNKIRLPDGRVVSIVIGTQNGERVVNLDNSDIAICKSRGFVYLPDFSKQDIEELLPTRDMIVLRGDEPRGKKYEFYRKIYREQHKGGQSSQVPKRQHPGSPSAGFDLKVDWVNNKTDVRYMDFPDNPHHVKEAIPVYIREDPIPLPEVVYIRKPEHLNCGGCDMYFLKKDKFDAHQRTCEGWKCVERPRANLVFLD